MDDNEQTADPAPTENAANKRPNETPVEVTSPKKSKKESESEHAQEVEEGKEEENDQEAAENGGGLDMFSETNNMFSEKFEVIAYDFLFR